MQVTFSKNFYFRPKLSRNDAWKNTVVRYTAGVEYDVEDDVITAAILAGALPAPEPVEDITPEDFEGE